tara:strand:- start:432 stop:755 length:324 start_codon:yes stop_codon:yes gene_type:complete
LITDSSSLIPLQKRKAKEIRGRQKKTKEGRRRQKKAEEDKRGQKRAEEGRGGQKRAEEGRRRQRSTCASNYAQCRLSSRDSLAGGPDRRCETQVSLWILLKTMRRWS